MKNTDEYKEYTQDFLTTNNIRSESDLDKWIRNKYKPLNLSIFLAKPNQQNNN